MKKFFVWVFLLGLVGCQSSNQEASSVPSSPVETASPEEALAGVAQADKVEIREFFDFGCSHCREAARIMTKVKQAFGDKLTMNYHHFPLKPKTLRVAEASECARNQGEFLAFHDQYFQRMFGRTDDEALIVIARDIGLDMRDFMLCLSSGVSKEKIAQDKMLADSYGVNGTPFFVINESVILPGLPGEETMRGVIEQLLGE